MDNSLEEEIRFSEHFYSYLAIILVAAIALLLVGFEQTILRQFRTLISAETLNSYYLIWFAVCSTTAAITYLGAVAVYIIDEKNRFIYLFWYLFIISSTLLFSTLLYDITNTNSSNDIGLRALILLISNIPTFIFFSVFYFFNFEKRHNFWIIAFGIMAATTAYNWLFVSLIPKISII